MHVACLSRQIYHFARQLFLLYCFEDFTRPACHFANLTLLMAVVFVFFFTAVVAHPFSGSEHLTVPGEPLVVLLFATASFQAPILL